MRPQDFTSISPEQFQTELRRLLDIDLFVSVSRGSFLTEVYQGCRVLKFDERQLVIRTPQTNVLLVQLSDCLFQSHVVTTAAGIGQALVIKYGDQSVMIGETTFF